MKKFLTPLLLLLPAIVLCQTTYMYKSPESLHSCCGCEQPHKASWVVDFSFPPEQYKNKHLRDSLLNAPLQYIDTALKRGCVKILISVKNDKFLGGCKSRMYKLYELLQQRKIK